MRKSLNTKLANKEKSALSTEKLERNEFYAVVNRQRLKIQYISRRNTDYIAIVVAIAQRIHLYSSRTQKLSSAAPKVLDGQLSGRIGRRHIIFLDSSAAEHPAVNRRVVGSNPTRGAIFVVRKSYKIEKAQDLVGRVLFCYYILWFAPFAEYLNSGATF